MKEVKDTELEFGQWYWIVSDRGKGIAYYCKDACAQDTHDYEQCFEPRGNAWRRTFGCKYFGPIPTP